MAAKTDTLERLRACHKEAQAAIRTALEVDEKDGGGLVRHCSTWLPGNGMRGGGGSAASRPADVVGENK